MDGSQGLQSQNATSEPLTLKPGAVEWIALQRDFLAKISAQQEKAQVSVESEADCFSKSQEQLTLFGPDTSSLKTARLFEPEAATSSFASSWRVDMPTATGKLERLTLVRLIGEPDGFCLLPTPTVSSYGSNQGGSAGRTGKKRKSLAGLLPTLTASELSGGRTVPKNVPISGTDPETGRKYQVGIKEALKRLPTLMAADGEKHSINTKASRGTGNYYLTGRIARLPTLIARDYKPPCGEKIWNKDLGKRSKPLPDTLAHTTGHRLTATVAEWFMGFPLNHTASKRWAMRKSRSKRQRRGSP